MDYPYLLRPEHRCYGKVTQFGKIEWLDTIRSALLKEQLKKFRKSCFGKFLQLSNVKFPGCTTHEIIMLMLKCNKENEVWFKFNGLLTRFRLYEFAVITGLPCGPPVDGFDYDHIIDDQCFYTRVFGPHWAVKFPDLYPIFLRCRNSDDKYDLLLLLCLEGLIWPTDRRTTLKTFHCPDTGEGLFNPYPWETHAFRMLRKSAFKNHTSQFRAGSVTRGNDGKFSYTVARFLSLKWTDH